MGGCKLALYLLILFAGGGYVWSVEEFSEEDSCKAYKIGERNSCTNRAIHL